MNEETKNKVSLIVQEIITEGLPDKHNHYCQAIKDLIEGETKELKLKYKELDRMYQKAVYEN